MEVVRSDSWDGVRVASAAMIVVVVSSIMGSCAYFAFGAGLSLLYTP